MAMKKLTDVTGFWTQIVRHISPSQEFRHFLAELCGSRMRRSTAWGSGDEAEAEALFRTLPENAELLDGDANARREVELQQLIGPCNMAGLVGYTRTLIDFAREGGYQDLDRDFSPVPVACPRAERRWKEALIRWLLEHSDLQARLAEQSR
jgi:hypothetical protein